VVLNDDNNNYLFKQQTLQLIILQAPDFEIFTATIFFLYFMRAIQMPLIIGMFFLLPD